MLIRCVVLAGVVAIASIGSYFTSQRSAPGDDTLRSRSGSTMFLQRVAQVPVRSPRAVAWSPDARRLAVSADDGDTIVVFDSSTWAEVSRFTRPGDFRDRTFSFSSNAEIVTYADRNDIHGPWMLGAYDSETGRLLRKAPRQPGEHSGRMHEIVVTTDGKHVVVLTDKPGSSVPVFGAANLELVAWLPLPADTNARALARGPGSQVALGLSSAGRDLPGLRKAIHIYDVDTRALDRAIPAHVPDITAIAWSPDGLSIASGADADPIRLWDRQSGRLIRSFGGIHERVTGMTWHPSGTLLATKGRRNAREQGDALGIWSPAHDSALFELRAPEAAMLGPVSFHPRSGHLLMGWKDALHVYEIFRR